MEHAAPVAQRYSRLGRIAALARAERAEVLGGARREVGVELEDHSAGGSLTDGNVEVDARIGWVPDVGMPTRRATVSHRHASMQEATNDALLSVRCSARRAELLSSRGSGGPATLFRSKRRATTSTTLVRMSRGVWARLRCGLATLLPPNPVDEAPVWVY